MQRIAHSTVIASATWAQSKTQVIDLDAYGNPDLVGLSVVYANGTTAAKTFASGVREVDQITFAAKASTGDGDYFVINDWNGLSWAVALDTTGGAANTPTGAAWTAVPSGRKVYTDISGATSGTDVELLVATAINALSGFTAVITTADSTTHMNCTAVNAGVVTAPTVYSKAGAAGTGSITKSVTTPGTASKVNIATDQVTITAHGQVLGSKGQMTTSSALPTGLSTSTDYFIIVIDANTVQFATSLANAVAGTAIDLTNAGVGTQTFTPTTSTSNVIKAQFSMDGVNGTDITTTNNPSCPSATVTVSTTSGATNWDLQRPVFRYILIVFTPSAGQITFSVALEAKKDK